MPPVMLATVVPCRLPPASTRIESGVLAFSAATSARLTLSLARWPAEGAGGKNGHGDVTHPHKALDALGAVGQRGGDGTLAAAGLGAHKAVLIHGRHILVAGGPENFRPAIFLVRLVGGQVHVGILAVQMQLRLAGVVDKNRRGRFAVAAGNFAESKRPHDEINIHRLALDTVVRARLGIAALPHIVGAGVAQFVAAKRAIQSILAPGV